jgi:hypothetical protein
LRIASNELIVVPTQLREMLTAMWSEKAAQEDEHDGAATELGQGGQPARFVGK